MIMDTQYDLSVTSTKMLKKFYKMKFRFPNKMILTFLSMI